MQFLYCHSTQVSDLGTLSGLTNLQRLDCSSTQVRDLGALSGLVNLQQLNCSSPQVSDLGSVSGVSILELLFCSSTQVSDLVSLSGLSNLELLDCSSTQVSDLSSLLSFLKNGIPFRIEHKSLGKNFLFKNCPLVHPPIEILKEGNEAILNYFDQLEKDQGQELLEAKALLIGEGMSGKTSLRNRLLGRELPNEPDRTKGLEVEVEPYRFPLAEEKEMQLNLFDFGGQDHYKPLHQFFYSKRSLYLLLTKNGDDQNDFDFWLETAQLHGDNSPLIVINNLFGDVQCNFNLGKWAKEYPFVKESLEVNLGDSSGLAAVKQQIEAYAQTLPHIRQVVPKSWAAIRTAVMERAKEENYIPLSEYLKICRQNGIEERKPALLLSQYLHDIGVFFHFQGNTALRRWVILRNEWATDAVYRILDDAQVRKQKGHFTQADYERIWSAEEYLDMQDALLALMEEFRLCYPKPKGGEYIAPSLLPIEPAKYDWSSDVEQRTIRLEYKFMPRILFTQFLVTEHEKIENERLCVWRTGAVFCKRDTRVEARQLGKNVIELRAQGSKMVELLTILNDTLDELHETTPGVKVERLIPCICSQCKTATKPYIFKKSRLDNRLRNNRAKDECQESFEEVSIPELLGNVLLPDDHAMEGSHGPRGKTVRSRTMKIFIASSEDLAKERDQLEILIRRQNDELWEGGMRLQPVRWENFLDTISPSRLQDEYNEELKQCDIVICLFHTKVGQYTAEEFDTALGQFRENGSPKILTYFKETPVEPSQVQVSLIDFKAKLKDMGHFWTSYKSLGDLKHHFSEQLKKLGIM